MVTSQINMAPPGYVPPSYVQHNIPERYMHKNPPPPDEDTNASAYMLFFSYVGLCVFLTVFIILKIMKRYNGSSQSTTGHFPAKAHVRTFAILAALSLFTTWYYMLNHFRVSYQAWAMWRSRYDVSQDRVHWGLWLKETPLFREAWETVVVGNARYWWSHQIIFFASTLGLSLEGKGISRGIGHTWAFMLLAQVVSVSFATNLYLLSLLVTPPQPPPHPVSNRRKWLGPWLINLLSIILTMWSAYQLSHEHYWFHQEQFVPMLLTPHVALLIMPMLRSLVPRSYLVGTQIDLAGSANKFLWAVNNLGGIALFFRVTTVAYNFSGLRGIWQQLWEHPVVSSVAFDVTFCWTTWIAWWAVQKSSFSAIPQTGVAGKENGWAGAGSGRAVEVKKNSHTVRRR